MAFNLDLSGFNDQALDAAVEQPSDNRFRLLSTLISAPDLFSKSEKEFRDLKELICTNFLRYTADVGVPGESALYAELLALLDDLHHLVDFPYLANKNIVAIGGEFSAGKSYFLNSIFDMAGLLPTGTRPTTAIPTYLTAAESESIRALNTFNRAQILTREELTAISHGFNANQSDDGGKISFYHILDLLQVQSPAIHWSNIAVLDTPGYSKPKASEDGKDADVGTEAGNTDEEMAKEHLRRADHLIWVVSVKDGTFQHAGLEFLRNKVQWKKPIYLLVNKADEVIDTDLPQIFNEICSKAEAAGFKLAGRSAYSSVNREVCLGDDPATWFAEIDRKRKLTSCRQGSTTWREAFKSVLGTVIRFCNDVDAKCSGYKDLLDFVTLSFSQDLEDDKASSLRQLRDALEKECAKRKASVAQFSSFSEKVEKQLDHLLNMIGVSEETAADVGIMAVSYDDATLLRHKKGDTFAATVEAYSVINGCYLTTPEAANQIQVKSSEVKKVSAPATVFAKGKRFMLTVYEVNFSKRQVMLNVSPM